MHMRQSAIDVDWGSVRSGLENSHHRVFEDGAVFLLGFDQRRFGALAFADVLLDGYVMADFIGFGEDRSDGHFCRKQTPVLVLVDNLAMPEVSRTDGLPHLREEFLV